MDESDSDDQPQVADLLGKLRFLAKIEPGEKLNVETLTLIDVSWPAVLKWPPLLVTKCNRGSVETRAKTFAFIKKLSNEALETAEAYLLQEDGLSKRLGAMIIESLKGSIEGMQALSKTYEDDRMFVSNVEAFIDVLRAKITSLEGR